MSNTHAIPKMEDARFALPAAPNLLGLFSIEWVAAYMFSIEWVAASSRNDITRTLKNHKERSSIRNTLAGKIGMFASMNWIEPCYDCDRRR